MNMPMVFRVLMVALMVALCTTSAQAKGVFAVTAETGDVEAIDTTAAKAWSYGEPDLQVSRNGLLINVYIMDIRNDTHAGFALDAPAGASACARLVDVLEYMADMLNEKGTLDLLIKESGALGSGFDVYGGTYFTDDTSSQAGAALYRLRTGEKQTETLPDMFLTVDFGHLFNFSADAPGLLELDFQSLLLHGLTHSLGALSLMSSSGASTIYPGIYSEWDWHVVRVPSAAHLVTGDPPDYATFAGNAADLTSRSLAFEGPDSLKWHGAMPEIYSPLRFVAGASICHWGENIPNGAVLELVTPLGTERRHWAPVDLGALKDIGYSNISEEAGAYEDSDASTGCAAGSITPGSRGPAASGLEWLLVMGALGVMSLRRMARKKGAVLLVALLALALGMPAYAELQNVVVGGSIQIRGNWFDYDGLNAIRIAPNTLAKNRTTSDAFVEERTRLGIAADLTENVGAFVELDSYDVWGDGFRTNYASGVDVRPAGDVNIYQAYIETKEMWGTPLRLRAGRQEIELGRGWLVGTGGTAPYNYGLSFDALRLTYGTDQFSVDAIAAKQLDRSPLEEDGDIDFYCMYGRYLGIQNVALEAYWMFVRNAASVDHSRDMHTLGVRGAGTLGAFDFDAEGAYQHTDSQGAESVDSFAGTVEAGYTLDMSWTPRLFLGGAYFDGDEDGAFDRLFSDVRYSQILDSGIFAGARLMGFWIASLGASVAPTEALKFQLSGAYLCSADSDSSYDNELGWELDASAAYNYTHDLAFQAGYSHFFASNGLSGEGALLPYCFNPRNVSVLDDVNYFYLETKIVF